MIDRKVMRANAAILAGVMIADEDLAAREFYPGSGTPDEVPQTDDRGSGVHVARSCDAGHVLLEDIGLPTDDQNERTPDIANVERFVVLVQDQNGVIHPADSSRFRIAAVRLRTRYPMQPIANA